ncbi:hypothetical protein [Streptomyces sp. x-19]|uniref:hypothetical protein n=1 Tax=Streptomyces sp. x-19 TaxID=2789280 RepID=UPI003980B59D
MSANSVSDRTADELCKRLNDALRAAGFDVEPALVATLSTRGGALVDKVAPPLFDERQTERLCRIVEAARR